MLLTLLCIVCLIVGILLAKYGNDYYYSVFVGKMIFLMVGTMGLFYMIVIIICSHVEANQTILENQIEYEAIIAEIQSIDTENEDVSKVQVIKDVKEWNKSVQSSKYWASNPWTNWCYSQKVVNAVECIEIPEWNIVIPDSSENKES